MNDWSPFNPASAPFCAKLVGFEVECDWIESIAAALGMSSFRFARGFKNGTGQSPHQFLVARRIEFAKDLLRSPDRTLADIARVAGFSTQSHFTVVFGQRCKMTPLAYRNANRRS